MEEQKKVPALRFQGFKGEWAEKRLGEVSLKIQDGTHFSPQTLESGEFFYITSRNIRDGILDLSSLFYIDKESHQKIYKRCDVKEGDILITKDGAGTGNACINTLAEEFSLLSSVAFIRANAKLAVNEFIYQALLCPIGQKEIKRSVSGQAITRITLSKLRGYAFFFPTIPEQQKIASFLTAADKRIQLLTQKKDKLERYKKGVMKRIFSQELRFKDAYGKDFPDWEEKKLGEVYTFKSTNSFSRDNLNYESGSVKNIHYGDIHTKFKTHFDITKELVPFINSDIALHKVPEENYLQEGDLVIADASEDYADIGKTIEVVNLQGEKAVAGLHTFLARRMNDSVEIGFGGHLMKNQQIRLAIMKIAQGTKVLSISTKRLSDIEVLLPSRKEQQKIASFLSALDCKIEQVESQIEKSKAWKKGLLQGMFV